MEQFYTDERNVQILISLLKQHGINRIIASPGSTNVTFVASCQQDPYFEMYSCVDERSAAYMACGMAAQTKEPVVVSCTGATASRNYFPALTEAFYRGLPILAVTSTQDESKIGHLIAQVIDRSQQPKDTVKMSVHLQNIKDKEDEWDCMIKANKAILELKHHGTGPVHINLSTRYSADFSVKELPVVHKIDRITLSNDFPQISVGKIAIYVGSHLRFSQEETNAIERFCESNNAVVFADINSNYNGKYKVQYDIASCQCKNYENKNIDLLIHIGEMSDKAGMLHPKIVWRVSESGEIQDRYKKLSYVFEMPEKVFFEHYANDGSKQDCTYYQLCMEDCRRLWGKIPELPFSHIWVASQMHDKLPKQSILHLGILSPLRSWSYFNIDSSIEVYCNQGGFGIDGNISSMIGASFVAPEKLFFCVVGDLSFFYDMNSIGNRHIGKNIRILLINNALGAEFMLFKQTNIAPCVEQIPKFISADGHFGRKSPDLVRHYAEDLGFEYMSAASKDEFLAKYERFITPEITDKPMVFEVFTDVEDEDKALWEMWHIEEDTTNKAKEVLKNVLGGKAVGTIKKIVKG